MVVLNDFLLLLLLFKKNQSGRKSALTFYNSAEKFPACVL